MGGVKLFWTWLCITAPGTCAILCSQIWVLVVCIEMLEFTGTIWCWEMMALPNFKLCCPWNASIWLLHWSWDVSFLYLNGSLAKGGLCLRSRLEGQRQTIVSQCWANITDSLHCFTWTILSLGPSRSKVMDDWGGEHQPNASKWLPAMNPSLKEVGDPRLSSARQWFRICVVQLWGPASALSQQAQGCVVKYGRVVGWIPHKHSPWINECPWQSM